MATDVFQPWGTQELALEEVPRSHSVIFYLRHPEKQADVLLLEMELSRVGDFAHTFESIKAVWKKSSKGDAFSQPSPLEISTLRLSRHVLP